MSKLSETKKRIQIAANSAGLGRAPELVAISKTKPVLQIMELYREGQRVFGENYVQELIEKKQEIDRSGLSDIEFHFVGHLQTNKVKTLLPYVTTLHAVDSIHLYEELLKRAENIKKIVSVYFQINIDEENSKSGFLAKDLPELAQKIVSLKTPWVNPIGLMAIPDPKKDPARAFQRMQELSARHEKTFGSGLSMGMSDDFELAISFGATAVRIGSALFGSRE